MDPGSSEAPSIQALLRALAEELRRQGVWEPQAPSADALSSPLPFCCDTLVFTQWLQWILIPRLTALGEACGPLPAQSAIRPMAEESLAGCPWPTRGTIELLGRLDDLINARSCPPPGAAAARAVRDCGDETL